MSGNRTPFSTSLTSVLLGGGAGGSNFKNTLQCSVIDRVIPGSNLQSSLGWNWPK